MPPDQVHDPDLLDALETMDVVSLERSVWRVTWATRNALTGGTGGGRWHPPNAFEALCTSFEENGAIAEIYYHLAQAPVFSSSAMKLSRLQIKTERTLMVPGIDALAAVGVDRESFERGDYNRTREIGAAAYFLDLDGLAVPSARWNCLNLVLLPGRLRDLDALRVTDSQDINWPAWREAPRLNPSESS